MIRPLIALAALLVATGAGAQDNSRAVTMTPRMLSDFQSQSHALVDCYTESFNTRKLCALLGDTPGCVKWLAAHPDPDKDTVE